MSDYEKNPVTRAALVDLLWSVRENLHGKIYWEDVQQIADALIVKFTLSRKGIESEPILIGKYNEPPVGTWVRDKFGATSCRQSGGGWGQPGIVPLGRWEAMWEARGPYELCGPWGRALSENTTEQEGIK